MVLKILNFELMFFKYVLLVVKLQKMSHQANAHSKDHKFKMQYLQYHSEAIPEHYLIIKLKQPQKYKSKINQIILNTCENNKVNIQQKAKGKKMFELQIIIQQIKALGYLFPHQQNQQKSLVQPQQSQQILQDLRRFRISFGERVFISKQHGIFKSRNQLCFYEPYTFFYDNHSRILNIQIFKEHQFGKNDDYRYQLNAEVDLSDFSVIKGDYIQATLTDIYGSQMGRILLVVDVFKKGPRFYQKVVSSVLFQKVHAQAQKWQREHKVSAANKNIRNLIVNNQLSNLLMTINSMHVIPEIEDQQIFNKQCFLLIKYGPNIKAFTKIVKSLVKDSTSFMDYLQFPKNQQFKFQFFFLYIDELGAFNCKARGQIKYIVFDQTINAHSILLFDKKSNKYGMLMVKFLQKQVEGNPNIIYKSQKKIRENQPNINQAIDTFNRYKFQAKYNNHVLSQKINQLELQRQKQEQQRNRPMNEQQKRKAEQHKKFIQFLQKQVLRIQRELVKRQEKNKQTERKQKYLPNVMPKKTQRNPNSVNKSMHVSASSSQFRDGKIKLPKV